MDVHGAKLRHEVLLQLAPSLPSSQSQKTALLPDGRRLRVGQDFQDFVTVGTEILISHGASQLIPVHLTGRNDDERIRVRKLIHQILTHALGTQSGQPDIRLLAAVRRTVTRKNDRAGIPGHNLISNLRQKSGILCIRRIQIPVAVRESQADVSVRTVLKTQRCLAGCIYENNLGPAQTGEAIVLQIVPGFTHPKLFQPGFPVGRVLADDLESVILPGMGTAFKVLLDAFPIFSDSFHGKRNCSQRRIPLTKECLHSLGALLGQALIIGIRAFRRGYRQDFHTHGDGFSL